jgi:hypothetical protein
MPTAGGLATPQQQRSPSGSERVKPKTLKERGEERDTEVPGSTEAHSEYTSLDGMRKEAAAIVYGRIIDSKSFWDESFPPEYGENITTEYAVAVYRVLRDVKRTDPDDPARPAPAPLTTPLTIARNGGVVEVNGHRASVKVKEYEALAPGREYVFFLFWSPDYKAYTLAGGASGAVLVNDDRSLTPLASSKEIREQLRGVDLDTFLSQLSGDR